MFLLTSRSRKPFLHTEVLKSSRLEGVINRPQAYSYKTQGQTEKREKSQSAYNSKPLQIWIGIGPRECERQSSS
ncbi:hypothetical protein Mapa_005651 [Marchantia paleacea]|nr:hypothetical protein Mapa_005651 [Marchantia paleacea]